eukprot:CAMPEP_0115513836 /NCGR_PEP_ID=MMETSP0271-20121206/75302_1 /TAXON_ID=71861 /ORGANISM="Scrippsiella trochoidea, Strain CCMP3099" /LENGTH=414 /DNA_ID=CAMNT_0002944181 /DNA_START=84 /DNA_END=1325 /DNA_ORIENTATION=+
MRSAVATATDAGSSAASGGVSPTASGRTKKDVLQRSSSMSTSATFLSTLSEYAGYSPTSSTNTLGQGEEHMSDAARQFTKVQRDRAQKRREQRKMLKPNRLRSSMSSVSSSAAEGGRSPSPLHKIDSIKECKEEEEAAEQQQEEKPDPEQEESLFGIIGRWFGNDEDDGDGEVHNAWGEEDNSEQLQERLMELEIARNPYGGASAKDRRKQKKEKQQRMKAEQIKAAAADQGTSSSSTAPYVGKPAPEEPEGEPGSGSCGAEAKADAPRASLLHCLSKALQPPLGASALRGSSSSIESVADASRTEKGLGTGGQSPKAAAGAEPSEPRRPPLLKKASSNLSTARQEWPSDTEVKNLHKELSRLKKEQQRAQRVAFRSQQSRLSATTSVTREASGPRKSRPDFARLVTERFAQVT